MARAICLVASAQQLHAPSPFSPNIYQPDSQWYDCRAPHETCAAIEVNMAIACHASCQRLGMQILMKLGIFNM